MSSMASPRLAKPGRNAVQFSDGPASAYHAFIEAIATRNFDDINSCSTERLRADLRRMRAAEGFRVLFHMWCDSYPPRMTVLSIEQIENTATIGAYGDVAGVRVFVQVSLQHAGMWLVDSEYFGRPTRHPAATSIETLDTVET